MQKELIQKKNIPAKRAYSEKILEINFSY